MTIYTSRIENQIRIEQTVQIFQKKSANKRCILRREIIYDELDLFSSFSPLQRYI